MTLYLLVKEFLKKLVSKKSIGQNTKITRHLIRITPLGVIRITCELFWGNSDHSYKNGWNSIFSRPHVPTHVLSAHIDEKSTPFDSPTSILWDLKVSRRADQDMWSYTVSNDLFEKHVQKIKNRFGVIRISKAKMSGVIRIIQAN